MTTEVLVFDANGQVDTKAIAAAIRAAHPDLTVHVARSAREGLDLGGKCEILICSPAAPSQAVIDAMGALRWMHFLSAGVDALARLTFSRRPIITSARGGHGPQMSELAFLLIISALRNFPRMLENQKAHIWKKWPQLLLYQKTILVVGVGAIAEDLAKRCKAFGMTVIGVSGSRTDAPGFDEILPRAALGDALSRADIITLLTPYTPENHMMFDAGMFARMQPHSILINLGRGKIVDEAALREALISGRIHHAAMDVFAVEPLPADDPLWDCPRLTIVPHIGGYSNIYTAQMIPIVLDNLAIWRAGNPDAMRNLVR